MDDVRAWAYALRHGASTAQATIRRHRVHRRPPASVVIRGVQLALSGAWATAAVRTALCDGTYEASEAAIVSATVAADDRVLDIGCGAGFVSALASRRGATVYGYEANPAMIAVARQTLSANGQTGEVINAVLQVAPRATEVTFYVREDFTTSNLVRTQDATGVQVQVLDFEAEILSRRATYLVIDIEGAETDLLLAQIPACVRKLCVECHPAVTGQSALSAMIAALLRQNFVMDVATSRLPVLYFER